MLVIAQRNQVSGIDKGLLVKGFVFLGEFFSVRGENVRFPGLDKHLMDEGIGVVVPGIAGTMTAIVADIEGLVAFGGRAHGPELIQAVRAFHAVRLAGIGLYDI